MHYFYSQYFYNGPDVPSRSRALIQNFIDNGSDCPLYIITTVDKRDGQYWEILLEEFGLSANVTIDSWFRLSHYKDTTDAHFIFDGDYIYSKGKQTRYFLDITKNNSWDAAANYHDVWADYATLFIACGFYKNKAEFYREHISFKPNAYYPVIDSYTNVNKLVDNLNKIRVLPPFQSERSEE